MVESEVTTSRARRRGNKKGTKTKEDELPIGIELDLKPPFKINHLSIENLQEAHLSSDLKGYTFFLTDGYSELHAIRQDKIYKASLAIYDKDSDQIEVISFDSTQLSCFSLWNGVAFLYFDKIMSERFSFAGKNFKDCLMYADLRAAFNEKSPTKGVVIFAPVVKNPDALMKRTLIVDEIGVFLLGGSKINTSNKRAPPISHSNQCSYYEIEALEQIGTTQFDGQMDSMEQKRDDLIVCQNEEKLFVAGRTNFNPEKGALSDVLEIEVFEKEDMVWAGKFSVKYDSDMSLYYNLSVLGPEKQIYMLLVGYRRGKSSSGYVIDTSKAPKSKESSYCYKLDKIVDEKGNTMVLTGFETFQMHNCYPVQERLLLRNYKKDIPEIEKYSVEGKTQK